MRPFVFIEKHYGVGINGEYSYYSISDALTNKNWIVQHNTALREIIHYAMGYCDAKDYQSTIYFAYNVDLIANGYAELDNDRLTEAEFQKKRKEVVG